MSTLASQAHRITRRSWKENPDAGFQEIASILASVENDTTGPIAVNLQSANAPAVAFSTDPQDSLNLPVFDPDSPDSQGQIAEISTSGNPQSEGRNTVEKYRTFTVRSCVSGRIVSYQSGTATYTVDLYPNGDGANAIRVTGVIPLHFGGGAGTQVPNNKWTPVMRISQFRVTTTEYKERNARVSLSSEINLVSQKHFFVNQDFLHDDLTLDGNLTLPTNKRVYFRNTNTSIYSSSDGNLDLDASDGVNIGVSGVNQVRVTNDLVTFLTGGTNPTLSLATAGQLRLTNGTLRLNSTLTVDSSTTLSGAVDCGAALTVAGSIDANSTLDVALTSDLHGTVHCYGLCTIDGNLDHNGSGIGFFGKSPAGQAGDFGAVTDSTGGSADGTLEDPGTIGVFDHTKTKNNFADIAQKLNQIRDVLRYHGLMA